MKEPKRKPITFSTPDWDEYGEIEQVTYNLYEDILPRDTNKWLLLASSHKSLEAKIGHDFKKFLAIWSANPNVEMIAYSQGSVVVWQTIVNFKSQ